MRKILCGLLAAGVVGVSGSALAWDKIEQKGTQVYGSKNSTVNIETNVNEKFSDANISNVDIGVYESKGKSTFTGADISVTANRGTLLSSFYNKRYEKDEDGNYKYDSNKNKIPVFDSDGNQVFDWVKDSYSDQKGLYAYKGVILLQGKNSAKVVAIAKNSNAYSIHTTGIGTEGSVYAKNVSLEAEASGDAWGVKNEANAEVNIGDVNTEKVSIIAKGSAAKAVYNMGVANIKGKSISIESVGPKGDSCGVFTYKNVETNIGTDDTKDISIKVEGKYVSGSNYARGINTGFSGKTNLQAETVKVELKGEGAQLVGIETSGNTNITADNVELDVLGKTNAIGVYSSSSKGNALSKAKDKLTIDVNGKAGSATAVTSNVGKVNLTAKTLNISASGNTAYTIDALSKADIEIGKGASELNLSAKGDKEAYIVNSTATNKKVSGNVKLGENASKINLVSEAAGIAHGVSFNDGTNLTIGGNDSEVSIKTNAGNEAIGVLAMQKTPEDKAKLKITSGGSVVNINGKSLLIDSASAAGEAQAIHVQNNTEDATDNFATVNVNNAKTVINAKTGIAAYSQGVVNMNNGDVEINAEKAIETRGNAVTNINQDGSHTVKINGDIDFNVTNDGHSGLNADAKVNINLNNADSYFNGKVNKSQEGESSSVEMNVTGMTMGISNGAAWNMTGDSFVNNADVSNGGSINVQQGASEFKADNLKLDNANLNLQGNNQNVDVQKLAGDNGKITTNSLDNQMNIEQNNAKNVSVNGTKEVTDAIASGNASLQDLADVVKSNDKSAADSVTSDANDIIGGYSAEVDSNGKVVVKTVKTVENTTNRAISDMANISLMTWRQENNDMNKRLGELRDSKGEHGAWARMARGESKYGSQNVKNQYNYYQVGYDEKFSTNTNWTVGVALTRTEGNSTFARGTGENKHTGFAVYGSYLNDNGSFIDLIAKYARMDNDYSTIGAGVGDASYETNGYSLSAEYGKRFTKDNGFWIEPQVELTYGTVGSVDYLTSKGARVHQDSVDSLVGRLGFSLGKDIKQGNVYVRASYLYDFDGETKATMSGAGTASFKQDLGGGWWEVGVGTNLNLSDATHLYFDVEKTYGGNVATPWQWNAGVRWSF